MSKLNVRLVSEVKDCFGVYELTILINEKEYTYSVPSEYAVRKFKSLLVRRHKPGSAVHLLKTFAVGETENGI